MESLNSPQKKNHIGFLDTIRLFFTFRKISKFIGDSSYGLYLVYLIVFYPVLYVLFQKEWFLSLTNFPRFALALEIVSPIVYGFAYCLFKTIEINGIHLGEKISTRFIA